ncbi:Lrp/AsnC family transcriptional regulator [Arthrobacter sp. 4R501]|uniref:Lrp/AsnC family transcriptional regulator n=1 Tax=Arthrobacter sp. 4R501 TaxID=2058886 RepID=UPI000CE457B1|nr:Lrp/AsnC family transcriptional regulator [Arthrobacter sp. 4R501]
MSSLDRLDSELIKRLNTNARAGVAELAAQLGISRNTVHARLQRLENEGILKGFKPVIDLEAAGLSVQAFVGLELEQRQLPHVIAGLRSIPQVLEVTTQAGREDLLVRVAAATLADLQQAVASMIEIQGVRHSNTTLSVSTPLPFRVQPLLDHLSKDSGWGRSTALPG